MQASAVQNCAALELLFDITPSNVDETNKSATDIPPVKGWADAVPQSIQMNYDYDLLLDGLDRSCREDAVDDIANHLSGALEVIEGVFSPSKTVLSLARRDRLLRAVGFARLCSGPKLASVIDKTILEYGFDALVGLVFIWAEPLDVRSQRHPDVLRDLRDHARILRNRCHDLCLAAGIEERAQRRDKAMGEALLRQAVQARRA